MPLHLSETEAQRLAAFVADEFADPPVPSYTPALGLVPVPQLDEFGQRHDQAASFSAVGQPANYRSSFSMEPRGTDGLVTILTDVNTRGS